MKWAKQAAALPPALPANSSRSVEMVLLMSGVELIFFILTDVGAASQICAVDNTEMFPLLLSSS